MRCRQLEVDLAEYRTTRNSQALIFNGRAGAVFASLNAGPHQPGLLGNNFSDAKVGGNAFDSAALPPYVRILKKRPGPTRSLWAGATFISNPNRTFSQST